jgi:hypothetical protein
MNEQRFTAPQRWVLGLTAADDIYRRDGRHGRDDGARSDATLRTAILLCAKPKFAPTK